MKEALGNCDLERIQNSGYIKNYKEFNCTKGPQIYINEPIAFNKIKSYGLRKNKCKWEANNQKQSRRKFESMKTTEHDNVWPNFYRICIRITEMQRSSQD